VIHDVGVPFGGVALDEVPLLLGVIDGSVDPLTGEGANRVEGVAGDRDRAPS
jgi:hypothetical protein